MLTLSKLSQPKNAMSPISFTVDGTYTAVSVLLALNACLAILTTGFRSIYEGIYKSGKSTPSAYPSILYPPSTSSYFSDLSVLLPQ